MVMKKIGVSLFAFALFAYAGTVSAQMGMMGNYWSGSTDAERVVQSSEVTAIIQDIYSTQGVTGQEQIDCSVVTDAQFERLGDAYMGVMLPNESQHEAMDNMMGGEGSQSLAQAHINMGRSYLGCWSDYNSGPVYMPMMGGYTQPGFFGHMTGSNLFPGWGMMGAYRGGASWFGAITMVLVWTLLILGIVALIKFITRK